jgi:hypothetical protein
MQDRLIPKWEADGFAGSTAEHPSEGTEKIMRCYSHGIQDRAGNWYGSRQYNNCFWIFRAGVDDGPISNKTIDLSKLNVDFLEANLNAALWNNTYQRVAVFQMRKGLKYRIGPVGQNTRGTQKVIFAEPSGPSGQVTSGKPESLTHTASYDYTTPVKALLQVVLEIPTGTKDTDAYLREVLTLVVEYPITGRERYLGAHSTHRRH